MKGKEQHKMHYLAGFFLCSYEQRLIVLDSTRENLEENNILRLHLLCMSDVPSGKGKVVAPQARRNRGRIWGDRSPLYPPTCNLESMCPLRSSNSQKD